MTLHSAPTELKSFPGAFYKHLVPNGTQETKATESWSTTSTVCLLASPRLIHVHPRRASRPSPRSGRH